MNRLVSQTVRVGKTPIKVECQSHDSVTLEGVITHLNNLEMHLTMVYPYPGFQIVKRQPVFVLAMINSCVSFVEAGLPTWRAIGLARIALQEAYNLGKLFYSRRDHFVNQYFQIRSKQERLQGSRDRLMKDRHPKKVELKKRFKSNSMSQFEYQAAIKRITARETMNVLRIRRWQNNLAKPLLPLRIEDISKLISISPRL